MIVLSVIGVESIFVEVIVMAFTIIIVIISSVNSDNDALIVVGIKNVKYKIYRHRRIDIFGITE